MAIDLDRDGDLAVCMCVYCASSQARSGSSEGAMATLSAREALRSLGGLGFKRFVTAAELIR